MPCSLKSANNVDVSSWVQEVFHQAIVSRASDIHFEPLQGSFQVRYRIDGALFEVTPPSDLSFDSLAAHIKVLAGLDIAQKRLPQDGKIQFFCAKETVDLRVSILPVQFGESIVIRVLDVSSIALDLSALGFSDYVQEKIDSVLEAPYGLFLATGPTGSGKTTTLYSMLNAVNSEARKILTIEDPVEYTLPGLMQVSINSDIGLTFARSLRSFMRHDPDIILVGEIRDSETAQIAVQASLTGHFVLSTLHTNDAIGSVTRLMDLGIEPFLITAVLRAAIAQRLVRTICSRCREAYRPALENIERWSINSSDSEGPEFFRGRGCDACFYSGYYGRTGIFELFLMNDSIREAIMSRESHASLCDLLQELGVPSLLQSGIGAVIDGKTTMSEIEKWL